MASKALLIGSSFSAAPMLYRLRARGMKVAVCGSLPTDPCHQYCDESHFIDYSKRDLLLDLVQREGFDYLVPTCNDYSYLSAAWVAQQTGHPGFDRFPVAEALHTKDRFRAACARLGMSVPHAIQASMDHTPDVPPHLFPVLIKPVDSFSGRGVTKVHHPSDISAALRNALKSSGSTTAVIEQFVQGQLHSHSAFVAGGRVVLDFFVDEFCTVYPYQVDCSNHPSTLADAVRNAVREDMQRLIDGLHIADGLLHTQFIAEGERHWIIETMRRCPGDLYSSLIERSTGIDYTDRFVAGFLGEAPSFGHPAWPTKLMGRHTISVDTEQVVHGFEFHYPGHIASIIPLKNSGETLSAAPYDKLAILFNEFDNIEQMVAAVSNMKDNVTIESLRPGEALQ